MSKSIQIQFEEEVQKRLIVIKDKFILKYNNSLEKEVLREQEIKECEGIFLSKEKKALYRVPKVVLRKEALAYTKVYQRFIVNGSDFLKYIRTPNIEDSFNVIISVHDLTVKKIVEGFSYYEYWNYLKELTPKTSSQKRTHLGHFFHNQKTAKELLPKLKEKFKNEKPQIYAFLCFALFELNLISNPIENITELHECLDSFFSGIGKRQGLNKNILNIEKERLLYKYGKYEIKITSQKQKIEDLLTE